MAIKVGDMVSIKGDKGLWQVEFIRGKDEKDKSFKEYGLVDGSHRAIVRAENIKEVE